MHADFAGLVLYRMSASAEPAIPSPGNWPVDPQDDIPILKDRIWVDGCFDFTHHGVLYSAGHLGLCYDLQSLISKLILFRACGGHAPGTQIGKGVSCRRSF